MGNDTSHYEQIRWQKHPYFRQVSCHVKTNMKNKKKTQIWLGDRMTLLSRSETEWEKQIDSINQNKQMGRLFTESLTGPRIFKCKSCKMDSASRDDIVSKNFQGRFGRAYLFRSV